MTHSASWRSAVALVLASLTLALATGCGSTTSTPKMQSTVQPTINIAPTQTRSAELTQVAAALAPTATQPQSPTASSFTVTRTAQVAPTATATLFRPPLPPSGPTVTRGTTNVTPTTVARLTTPTAVMMPRVYIPYNLQVRPSTDGWQDVTFNLALRNVSTFPLDSVTLPNLQVMVKEGRAYEFQGQGRRTQGSFALPAGLTLCGSRYTGRIPQGTTLDRIMDDGFAGAMPFSDASKESACPISGLSDLPHLPAEGFIPPFSPIIGYSLGERDIQGAQGSTIKILSISNNKVVVEVTNPDKLDQLSIDLYVWVLGDDGLLFSPAVGAQTKDPDCVNNPGIGNQIAIQPIGPGQTNRFSVCFTSGSSAGSNPSKASAIIVESLILSGITSRGNISAAVQEKSAFVARP